jgi:hypothetical protein
MFLEQLRYSQMQYDMNRHVLGFCGLIYRRIPDTQEVQHLESNMKSVQCFVE